MEKPVIFTSGGQQVVGMLHLPARSKKKVPGVVMFHGYLDVARLEVLPFVEAFQELVAEHFHLPHLAMAEMELDGAVGGQGLGRSGGRPAFHDGALERGQHRGGGHFLRQIADLAFGEVERARHQVAGAPGIGGQQGMHAVEGGGIEVVVGPFKRIVRLEALALGVAVEPVGFGGGIEEVDVDGENFSKRAEERQVGARHQGGRKDEDAPIGLTDAGKAEPGLHFPESRQIGGVGLAVD